MTGILVVVLIVALTGLTAWILVWEKGAADIFEMERVMGVTHLDVELDEAQADWSREYYWAENAE